MTVHLLTLTALRSGVSSASSRATVPSKSPPAHSNGPCEHLCKVSFNACTCAWKRELPCAHYRTHLQGAAELAA
eukprot:5082027-Pleurochrysis_carterae.AAC.1